MKKKTRNLIIVISVLIICSIAYLIIFSFARKAENNGDVTATESVFREYTDEVITGILLESKEGVFSFDYDSVNEEWGYTGDEEFPVSQTVLTSLVTGIQSLTYIRKITNYNSLSDFKLDEYNLKITVATDKGDSFALLFSDLSGNGNYYFKSDNDSAVYMTSSNFNSYASYSLYDFYQIVEIPDFSTYEIDSIVIGNLDTGRITVKENVEATEADGSNTIWNYIFEQNGLNTSETKQGNIKDTNVLSNYINEFTVNEVVAHNPDEETLKEYGLFDTAPALTVNFRGYTSKEVETETGSVINQLVETEFTYRLTVGYPVSDNGAQYYVMLNCIESENDNSVYNSNAVYTMNSYYAEYFSEFSEDDINGVNRILKSLLDDEDIPVINKDNLIKISFSYPNEDNKAEILDIIFDEDSVKYKKYLSTDASVFEEGLLTEAALNQMLEYLSVDNQLKYVEKIEGGKTETVLSEYGLDSPLREVTISFRAEYQTSDINVDVYNLDWKLSIGMTENSYYVTADNSDYIYKMNDSLIQYLLAVNENILNGTEIYGKSEIEGIK